MRKSDRSRIMILTVLGIFIFYVVISITESTGLVGGDWSTININMISQAPIFIGIGLGLLLLVKATSTILNSILVSGIIGILFAGLLHNMNTNNIWIDEIITATFTITDLQYVVVIFWLILGIIIGLIKR